MGIGDWGLGIGDWAQSPIPNPQSPIPNEYIRIIDTITYIIIHNIVNTNCIHTSYINIKKHSNKKK